MAGAAGAAGAAVWVPGRMAARAMRAALDVVLLVVVDVIASLRARVRVSARA